MQPEQIAIVTGANRGIGLEVVRQLAQKGITVILGARDLQKGEAAAIPLISAGLPVFPRQLDVTDPESMTRLAAQVEQEYGHLDILINNAGILYDTWQQPSTADLDTVQEAINTNMLGPWRMCKAFVPLLRRSQHGRIVNVSSGAGSIASMDNGTPAYSVSKAALNAFTRSLAAELKSAGILVNAICPGWVATDMGGAGGRPVEDGAASVVWAVMLADNGPTGGFFRDGQPVPW
ncbi:MULTISPECIES: SDR family oxidoreductase [unclassified Leptolyngbya]|uniref:SDR family oxidoreductase n=1 Tax=unclassified Leptolyngbya TaxID=2650499 RepID=UPI00168A0029|nr:MULTISPECIES: SDR family oxidoreductase [unclassified Leptolyngbya]MBD1913461.1 SDR family oxidoreductase [Leptolyngbya sp. FACHB-8]MBD2156324.1 SDR family oxidoreductase [Leptolyngbya sp. FACHB-16]